jgi:hypothetical protein
VDLGTRPRIDPAVERVGGPVGADDDRLTTWSNKPCDAVRPALGTAAAWAWSTAVRLLRLWHYRRMLHEALVYEERYHWVSWHLRRSPCGW